ncbi:MAG: AAA family ATPase [Bacteroidetes bacterium]|nr:AAA family ATPase [Bacteroidota bacterium]
MVSEIIGRNHEMEVFKHAMDSPNPEFIGVYGRRRVGKTYLIREFFNSDIEFELTGLHNASLSDQLENFAEAMGRSIALGVQPKTPVSWKAAFQMLETYLESFPPKKRNKKRVVFLDELPWMNTPRSKFLQSLEHFWNSYGSKKKDLVLIVCGSAASWMVQNIVRARGGLHNRLTRQIRLLPFNLNETKDFLVKQGIKNLTDYMITQLYMAFGGIPYYLAQVRKNLTPTQIIDEVIFSENGQLRHEYDQLYRSLFDQSDYHLKVVKVLAKRASGLTRNILLKEAGISSGGTASKILEELEESGFIESRIPFAKKSNDAIYRLVDEFTLFHLHWVRPLGNRSPGEGYWISLLNSPKRKAWEGFAFENVCLKHIREIKSALGIAAVETAVNPWRFAGNRELGLKGAQIDLLIDRKDGAINLCEMKFHESAFIIDQKYAGELRNKMEVFNRQTKSRKSIFLTMITTFGTRENIYSKELNITSLDLKVFFRKK